MKHTVSEDQQNMRLDVLAASLMPRLSRAFVQKLISSGDVLVNQQKQRVGYKAKLHDQININYDEAQLDEQPTMNLPTIYEDDDVLVINKPAGVLTHSQGKLNNEATVATFLRDKTATELAGDRAGIVHRLDRATSGVIIGAKNAKALSFLQKQFAQRKVKKTYIAIVQGHLKQKEAVVDMPIGRNPKAPATFRVSANGKPSKTQYKVLQENEQNSLVELKPETGRTHQLRVHLAELGNPIVNDPLYGKGSFDDRLYLHALSLEITLPNRERKTFQAPLPPEFKQYMSHG